MAVLAHKPLFWVFATSNMIAMFSSIIACEVILASWVVDEKNEALATSGAAILYLSIALVVIPMDFLAAILLSLIALWCESNNIELPKRQGNCRTKKCGGNSLSEDAATALIKLLCEGTPIGKKDVVTAIFNLSIYQGNKPRAVKVGIVAPLIQFLKDAGGGMVDEAVAIMTILAIHHEGRVAIGQAKPIHILVEVIRTGSPRNRDHATAVLWSLCTGDPLQLKLAKEHGAEAALQELSENGTDRAKIKA
ncbi:U-box domain-containing protein 12-like [Glycine max]|uniref:U-box domain-containing protein 12-like n=1 Tax=Glycine max TaxID=3847 RepID=UPI0003DEBEE4|nr:U-box domain-containing protein 12-like [Glycine max]|eukprot:XP_006582784.1 U-box domain-containing protein 12-like [Glycine max]